MDCEKILSILFVLLLIIIVIKNFSSSKFGNISDILSNNYQTNFSCKNDAGRIIPSGKLPGSTIMLTNSERDGLLKKFIDNGPIL